MSKSFWMPNEDASNENISRPEPKRAHHWFMDAHEPDWSCTKKRAIEAVNLHPTSLLSNENDVSIWKSTPSFESGSRFLSNDSNNLFKPEPIRVSSLPTQNFPNNSFVSLSMGPTFSNMDVNKERNFISMNPTISGGNDNIMSMGSAYTGGYCNLFPMGVSYNGENGTYSSISSVSQTHEKNKSVVAPMYTGYEIADPNYQGTEVSSGVVPLGSTNQPHAVMCSNNSSKGNADSSETVVAPAAKTKTSKVRKKQVKPKPAKKNTSPNSFPANVTQLLSTGILDGVPVKYFSWDRVKSMRGIIRGTRYLCDCSDCKMSKAVSAFLFEQHAGCKTKHPNNNIYFTNGKTIYGVVQELKNTPPENLFDAVKSVTGSKIHEENFRIWKGSYEAATRELERIYGKDVVVMPSA